VGRYTFAADGERVLDGRTLFHYDATGITPPTVPSKPGVGSAYALTARDSRGEYLHDIPDIQHPRLMIVVNF
jgi:hypothetical protein